MKIGLVSDIHSNLSAFKAVLKDMPSVDTIICMGDMVGYGAQPNHVLRLARSKKVRSTMGNHDYAALTQDVRGFNDRAANVAIWTSENLTTENSEYLAVLPTSINLKIGDKKIFVVHGSPRDPLNEYVFPNISNRDLVEVIKGVDADIILLGHTHIPMKRLIMGKIVVNPGGVGQPRDRDPRASYVVLSGGKEIGISFRRVEYNIDASVAKIKAAGLPEELATRLFFGW